MPALQKKHNFSYQKPTGIINQILFEDTKSNQAYIQIRFVSHEPVYIESLKLFAAGDPMYREFENALVITNPGHHKYTFDLSEISPGKNYRRIEGTQFQDPETNNGKAVGDKITLGKHDALFLVKK